MTKDAPLEGRIMPPKKDPVLSADALGALRQMVDTARECFVIHEEESTKRARLAAYEATEVAKIKAAEMVLKDYFAQAFAERRTIYEEMFTRLDHAMEADKPEIVHSVLRGIVDIAKESPLKDLGDLGQIRAALDDKDQVWDL